MKSKRVLTVILLGVILLTLGGCIGVNRNFKEVRSHVLSNINGSFSKEIEFSVGKGLISLGSIFISFADDPDAINAKRILHKLDRVQIGIYERHSREDIEFSRDALCSLTDLMEEQGLYYIVRSRDNGDLTAVFLRDDDDDEIRDMYVVHCDSNELVVVEVRGDIDDIIEIALKEANHKVEFSRSVAQID